MEKLLSEKRTCKLIAGLKINIDLCICKPILGLFLIVNLLQD